MKSLYKILITVIVLLILLSFGFVVYVYNSGPALPDRSDEIIEDIMNQPLPELVHGETGFAKSQGLDIWYENIAPKNPIKGTILLNMGISNDALGWPEFFIDSFLKAGYRVVRYDHRGVGMSDWVENWDPNNPYSLADMAADGIAVLDSVGVKKSHVIGISMGGMIAQEIAIRYPNRVTTLTSVMSSCYLEDPDLPPISSEVAWSLIKVSLKYGLTGGEKNMIKLHIASRMILRGDTNHKLNIEEIARQVLYNLRERNGYNFKVSRQHQAAVRQSGSRYGDLEQLRIPTLIIHGKSDPFIPIEHGRKCAEFIPDAHHFWVENMGHDIPDVFTEALSKKLRSFFWTNSKNQ